MSPAHSLRLARTRKNNCKGHADHLDGIETGKLDLRRVLATLDWDLTVGDVTSHIGGLGEQVAEEQREPVDEA